MLFSLSLSLSLSPSPSPSPSLSLSLSLPPSLLYQFVCYCYTKPLEETCSEAGGEVAPAAAVSQSSLASTMKEKARTHRLIFTRQPHSSPQSGAGSFQPDSMPLAAFTKVWYCNTIAYNSALLYTSAAK